MSDRILPHSAESPTTYSIKEFRMVVRDASVAPTEIESFMGAPLTGSGEVYRRFEGLARLPVECFVALHLNAKNRIVGMTTFSIGNMTGAMA